MIKTKSVALHYKCKYCGSVAYTEAGYVRIDHSPKCERRKWLRENFPAFIRMIDKERKEGK